MSEIPDKQYLYGRYNASEDWRQKLHKKLTHKSLDIPEDDDVHVDNSRTGIGWKELAVIAATIAGLTWMFNRVEQPSPSQPFLGPVDSEYEVRFFDKDGNPIKVPHLSERR